MTIWEITKAALTPLATPMAASRYIGSVDQLPDLFLVYSLISSLPELWADNLETLRSYLMQVSVYSRTGLTALPDVAGAMVTAGFTKGLQRELPYNQTNGHYGLSLEFVYLEYE